MVGMCFPLHVPVVGKFCKLNGLSRYQCVLVPATKKWILLLFLFSSFLLPKKRRFFFPILSTDAVLGQLILRARKADAAYSFSPSPSQFRLALYTTTPKPRRTLPAQSRCKDCKEPDRRGSTKILQLLVALHIMSMSTALLV